MPRFYDDYSNTYLTHDSAAGRKQQRRGWKFRENFKLHYEKYLDEWRGGPTGLAAAQQAIMKQNPGIAPLLPEGWIEEMDEATGAIFYTHEKSGRRTWVRPGFRPPPAGGGMPMGMRQPHMNHHHHNRPPPAAQFGGSSNFPPSGNNGRFPPSGPPPPPPQFSRPPPPPNFAAPPPSLPPPGVGMNMNMNGPPPSLPPPGSSSLAFPPPPPDFAQPPPPR